jgi:hypothetical protein
MTNRCIVCGAMGTTRWTIDNQHVAVVTDLCVKDAEPLLAIIELAGTVPPAKQHEPPRPELVLPPRRQIRKLAMEPLLDWTPPED